MGSDNKKLLEIINLVKDYKKVHAVKGISFSIEEGTCFGMLGPNGAGKTTTIEIMEGISVPTSGKILYRGLPFDLRYKQDVGIQFQSTALQEKQSCRETLRMFGKLYKRTVPLDTLIELCDLKEYIDRDTHKISGGQRQRLLLAIALVNDPRVIFMDEPTTGLDPSARHAFWNIVRTIKQQGKTLILTTHNMEEAHALCDTLIIMNRGEIIAQGKPNELLVRYFNKSSIRMPHTIHMQNSIPHSINYTIANDSIEICTDDVSYVLQKLLDAKVEMGNVTLRKPTLEDLFLQLTGNTLVANDIRVNEGKVP